MDTIKKSLRVFDKLICQKNINYNNNYKLNLVFLL